MYTPKELSEKLGVSRETLRLWANAGKLKVTKTSGGHRRYIYNEDTTNTNHKISFIYSRVSSAKQSSDLDRQITFLEKKYPGYTIVSDISSGINFKRPGLKTILEAVYNRNCKEIVIAHPDRLCRFGFELFTQIFKHFDTTLTVVDNKHYSSPEQELAEDIIQVITVFSARYYGLRKYK